MFGKACEWPQSIKNRKFSAQLWPAPQDKSRIPLGAWVVSASQWGRLSCLDKTHNGHGWRHCRKKIMLQTRIKYTRKSENRGSSNAFVVYKQRGRLIVFFVLFGSDFLVYDDSGPETLGTEIFSGTFWEFGGVPTSSGDMTYAQKRVFEKTAPMTSSRKIVIMKNKNKIKNGS